MGFFSKIFDPTAGEIKRLNKIVDKIDSFEEAHKALSDEQLRGKTVEFRERVKNGESLDDLLPELGGKDGTLKTLEKLQAARNHPCADTQYIVHPPRAQPSKAWQKTRQSAKRANTS